MHAVLPGNLRPPLCCLLISRFLFLFVVGPPPLVFLLAPPLEVLGWPPPLSFLSCPGAISSSSAERGSQILGRRCAHDNSGRGGPTLLPRGGIPQDAPPPLDVIFPRHPWNSSRPLPPLLLCRASLRRRGLLLDVDGGTTPQALFRRRRWPFVARVSVCREVSRRRGRRVPRMADRVRRRRMGGRWDIFSSGVVVPTWRKNRGGGRVVGRRIHPRGWDLFAAARRRSFELARAARGVGCCGWRRGSSSRRGSIGSGVGAAAMVGCSSARRSWLIFSLVAPPRRRSIFLFRQCNYALPAATQRPRPSSCCGGRR